ncbi:hypothetical protein QL285_030171 [Trifolium repens]|nr:hypothetical protein QL285_030171 [Trifolium repens]
MARFLRRPLCFRLTSGPFSVSVSPWLVFRFRFGWLRRGVCVVLAPLFWLHLALLLRLILILAGFCLRWWVARQFGVWVLLFEGGFGRGRRRRGSVLVLQRSSVWVVLGFRV